MAATRRGVGLALAAMGCLALGFMAPAQAGDGGLAASGAWSRPTAAPGMAGIVYLTVTDSGAPTRLIGAKTPVAKQAGLHETKQVNGMMEMLPIPSLPIGPGTPISFHPGGYHIMLMGLAKPLSVGETFPITLLFANGAEVTTTVTVRPMVPGNGMKM